MKLSLLKSQDKMKQTHVLTSILLLSLDWHTPLLLIDVLKIITLIIIPFYSSHISHLLICMQGLTPCWNQMPDQLWGIEHKEISKVKQSFFIYIEYCMEAEERFIHNLNHLTKLLKIQSLKQECRNYILVPSAN